ncbi:Rhodanese-like domain-containing protein 19 [Forsythia ovata]|uniref:Rhodanese-like domain-containing protein 19 n=1 Tax=Forsythia ovata TaxID=205694 RepID=A0ABD1T8U6_9LAMI
MDSTKSIEDVVNVDVETAKELLGSGHRYLDVRTSEEFNKSHVENAVNIPYMFLTQEGRVKNEEFLFQVSSVYKNEDPLIVGCNSGGRASRACVDLLNAGFKNVKNLKGGYSAMARC